MQTLTALALLALVAAAGVRAETVYSLLSDGSIAGTVSDTPVAARADCFLFNSNSRLGVGFLISPPNEDTYCCERVGIVTNGQCLAQVNCQPVTSDDYVSDINGVCVFTSGCYSFDPQFINTFTLVENEFATFPVSASENSPTVADTLMIIPSTGSRLVGYQIEVAGFSYACAYRGASSPAGNSFPLASPPDSCLRNRCNGVSEDTSNFFYSNTDGNCYTNCVTLCETDSDPENCGTCGSACSVNNITPSCTAGECTGTCDLGFSDCNNDLRTDGCETDIANDPSNCGSCGNVCSGANVFGGAQCSNGQCVGSCEPGFADCNNNLQTDGCESDINTDPSNCGSCGDACSTSNLTPSCNGGDCDGTCDPGFADCNNDLRTDGCEISTTDDADNCGGCSDACSDNNIVNGASCTDSDCTGICNPGFVDCNNDLREDGCEIDIDIDQSNCGSCGTFCSGDNVIGGPQCSGGQCVGPCQLGFADCNNNLQTDGCEIGTNNDPNNCGSCGTVCSGANVFGGAQCSNGQCVGSCEPGFADCNNNLQTDGCESDITTISNCGSCGASCSQNNVLGGACSSGSCTGTCATNYGNCNNDLRSDGCEVLLDQPNRCGACSGAGSNCLAPPLRLTTCVLNQVNGLYGCGGPCQSGYANCNGVISLVPSSLDGCEINILQSNSNCGTCNGVCSQSGTSSISCSNGQCVGTCAEFRADCDNNLRLNGCEADLTDSLSCGACGVTCTGGQTCNFNIGLENFQCGNAKRAAPASWWL